MGRSIDIDIRFADRRLAESCLSEAACQRRWGKDRCRLLQRRLQSLAAADTLSDMTNVPGHCHALRGDRHGEYAIDLWGPIRLIFETANEPVPLKVDGGTDITKVTAIRIKEVADYHD